MLGLEKVLDLQIHYNQLEYYIKELDKIENDEELPKLERTYISDKKNLEIIKLTYAEHEKEIRNITTQLEEQQEKLKKAETVIYDGWITDLKQLEHLNKEKDYLLDHIDNLENKIINILEKNESIEMSIEKSNEEISNKEKILVSLTRQIKKTIITTKNEIEKEKSEISKKTQEIEPELLKRYLAIRATKDTGIATIVDSACSECNIMIRPAQIDRIKLGKQIYNCENCERCYISKQLK